MQNIFNIQDGRDFPSCRSAFQLNTPNYSVKPLAETLLARRLERGERIYDRKNVNRCSPLGRNPSRGYAWEPDRRI